MTYFPYQSIYTDARSEWISSNIHSHYVPLYAYALALSSNLLEQWHDRLFRQIKGAPPRQPRKGNSRPQTYNEPARKIIPPRRRSVTGIRGTRAAARLSIAPNRLISCTSGLLGSRARTQNIAYLLSVRRAKTPNVHPRVQDAAPEAAQARRQRVHRRHLQPGRAQQPGELAGEEADGRTRPRRRGRAAAALLARAGDDALRRRRRRRSESPGRLQPGLRQLADPRRLQADGLRRLQSAQQPKCECWIVVFFFCLFFSFALRKWLGG